MKSQFSNRQKHHIAEAIANLVSHSTELCHNWKQRRRRSFPKGSLARRKVHSLREIAIQGEANATAMRKNALAAFAAFREKKYSACFAELTRCGDALAFNAAADVVAAKLLGKSGKGIE